MVSAEELAVDCELQCCHCNESVNYGDDYICHLMYSHNIDRNFHLELERLKKTTSTSNPFLCAAEFFLQLGSCKEAVR